MDFNDFLGSIAQENVSFTTQVIKNASYGENYQRVAIYIHQSDVTDMLTADGAISTAHGWVDVNKTDDDGVATKVGSVLAVTTETYAPLTKGMLQGWLYDIFANGFSGEAFIVVCDELTADESTAGTTRDDKMGSVYQNTKVYAYHKTILFGEIDSTASDAADQRTADWASLKAFMVLCGADDYLSSCLYLPLTKVMLCQDADVSIANIGTNTQWQDLLAAKGDALVAYNADETRNGALYTLGLALGRLNGSGTAIGNSFDMVASSMISASGSNGTALNAGAQDILKTNHIQYFKAVGDNSGNVAAVGATTIHGNTPPASWVVAYVTYMTKVGVAKLLTTPDFYRNAANYSRILGVLEGQLSQFGPKGSGRLVSAAVTAPSFGALPKSAADEVVIPNAWVGIYQDTVRQVSITGVLYIGV